MPTAAGWIEQVEAVLGDAITNSSLIADAEERIKYVGAYCIAMGEQDREPRLPRGCADKPAEGQPFPDIPSDELLRLEEAVGASVDAAELECESALGASGAIEALPLLCAIGYQLHVVVDGAKAGAIPTDAHRRLYTLCNEPPRVIRIDEFLTFPGPGYHFSMPRANDAKSQSWQLIKDLHACGQCEKLVIMSGNPAVGKSTWIETCGSSEPGAATTVFYDDLLNNKARRTREFWKYYQESGLAVPVEVVCITRDFAAACESNVRRGAKGLHQVPLERMEGYRDDFELATLEEGFSRVRVFENRYDEEKQEGGYALLNDLQEQSAEAAEAYST